MKTPYLLLLLAPALHAAPIFAITDDGIVIKEDGLEMLLPFPAIAGADGAPARPVEKSASDIVASLTYKGGGKINVSVLGGDITYTTASLPEDTTHLVFTLPIDPKSVAGGKYRFDRKFHDFPAEPSTGEADPATGAKTFGILPTEGPGLSFTFPAESKHRLIDSRQNPGNDFVWQCTVPIKSGQKAITLQIAGGEPTSILPAAE